MSGRGREAGDEAAGQHLLMEFRVGERLLFGLPGGGLGAFGCFGGCAGRLGHRLLKAGEGVADDVILAGVEAREHGVMDDLLHVFR